MKVFNTRNELLSIIPKNGVIAELGVFKADFSKQIYETCTPKKLVLIDIWKGDKIYSGDADGNFPDNKKEYYTGSQLHQITIDTVRNFNCEVVVLKEKTEVLATFPDNHFDFIYIDADHSYQGSLFDLELSFKKVKPDGFIMGHDYDQNMEKTKNIYNFGVKKAVNKFCNDYKQVVTYLAMDGCVSFGIQVVK